VDLDDVLRPEALLYMERYVDEGTRTYSPFAARSEVAPEYQPRSHRRFFDLVAVRVPRDEVLVLEANAAPTLLDQYVRDDEVTFLVHPETWSSEALGVERLRELPQSASVRVAPTASTRTVLAMQATPPHFLKLHYPKRISRFNRRLRLKNIQTSVAVTRDVDAIAHDRFAYLPDVLGIVLRGLGHPWGFLVRDAAPHPVAEGRRMIPLFALYGGDLDHPADRPLLVQLIERLGVEPSSFVVDEIMLPLVECWCAAANRGILLESHAQNVLLEIDASLRPTRMVHRDFDVWIDPEARAAARLPPIAGALVEADSEHERRMHYSLVYDHFVGRELLDYLLATAVRFFRLDEREVRARVSEVLRASFHDSSERFPPETTYYFTNELLPEDDFRLVDTGQRPTWR
jgi:siderophore synthetase component